MWPWSNHSKSKEIEPKEIDPRMLPFDYWSAHEFVRTYSTHQDIMLYIPYDLNGVVGLMLAAMENLKTNAEHRLEDELAECMSDDERFFLKELAEYACRITDTDIEKEYS